MRRFHGFAADRSVTSGFPPARPRQRLRQPRRRPAGNGDERSNDNDGQYVNNRPANRKGNGNRITGKQYRFIIDLMKEAGMTKREMNDHCMEAYGAVVDHISRSDASSLIDWLRSR